VILFLESLDFKIRHQHLLPKSSNVKLHQCTLWSDEQIQKIVESTRQIINMKSVEKNVELFDYKQFLILLMLII
jgi:hypothetical protein